MTWAKVFQVLCTLKTKAKAAVVFSLCHLIVTQMQSTKSLPQLLFVKVRLAFKWVVLLPYKSFSLTDESSSSCPLTDSLTLRKMNLSLHPFFLFSLYLFTANACRERKLMTKYARSMIRSISPVAITGSLPLPRY